MSCRAVRTKIFFENRLRLLNPKIPFLSSAIECGWVTDNKKLETKNFIKDFNMSIFSELLATLPPNPIPVRNVVIGVHWTLVASRHAALASTLFNCGPHGHSQMRDVGKLIGKSAQELAGWMESDNLLEASVGIAAFNSLVEVDQNRLRQNVNASEVIEQKSRDKNLVIVGHFPFAPRMKSTARNLWIIEKKPYGDDFRKTPRRI